MTRRPPRSPLFPYTTLYRSSVRRRVGRRGLDGRGSHAARTRRDRGRVAATLGARGDRGFHGGAQWSLVFHTARQSSRSEEHTSELQSQSNLVCRLLLEKKHT